MAFPLRPGGKVSALLLLTIAFATPGCGSTTPRSSPADRDGAGLTVSIAIQNAEHTKVKLYFDNVYYPALLAVYYDLIWRGVDKQMFLDKGLD